MGPFMVEIVFCRVTRRGRKKKKGMNKAGRENMRNDGPMFSFVPPEDTVKITLDLSDNGPVFGALDDMMLKLSLDEADRNKRKKGEGGDAKKALKNLLKSGIPGIEGMFAGPADQGPPKPGYQKKGGKKGFHKMNDGSKKKFMNAIFGEDGTQIDSSTAAALLAATCSGGNPEIGNNLAELLMPELGENVDPNMMAALMSACSLINAGASTEEVMKTMMLELAASGLGEEEILKKTQLLMKSFGKEEAGSTAEYKLVGKQKNSALRQAEISPKDFTAIALAHKAIAACGTTPENVGKILMIKSTLMKKGANPEHVASSLKNLGAISEEVKQDAAAKILKSWEEAKLTKPDVHLTVRVHQALDNENEPSWTEVKQMKDIVGGVSANSPEAIELNLARATKTGGLKKDDIGRGLIALKAISLLGVDPVQLAQVMFLEKTIASNGVPAVEIGRVLSDGIMPSEPKQSMIDEVKDKLIEDLKPIDVDIANKVYNNLKFKSNIPHEVIEHVDKTLIQVRCSLEDVADNMISTMSARGEKDHNIIRNVTETLKNTGATANIVAATMVPPCKELTGKNECELTKVIGRNLKDVEYTDDDVTSAVVEMTTKIIEENPDMREEACAAMEAIMKDMGGFPDQIRKFMVEVLPPPPTPPTPPMDPAIAAELERLRLEEVAREAEKLRKEMEGSDSEEEYDGPAKPKTKMAHKGVDALKRTESQSGSRRGSLTPMARSRQGSIVLGGGERRGSFYDEGVTTRASIAVVTEDPEQKKKLKKDLEGVFKETNEGMDLKQTNPNQEMGSYPNQASLNQEFGSHPKHTNQKQTNPNQELSSYPNQNTLNQELGSYPNQGNPNQELNSRLGLSPQATPGSGIPMSNGVDAISQVVGSMPEDATPEMIQMALKGALGNSGMSEDEINKLLSVFITDASRDGVSVHTVSEESRALMQQILSSTSNQEEINSRVTALLAGTALSTSRGEKPRGGGYGEVNVEAYNLPEQDQHLHADYKSAKDKLMKMSIYDRSSGPEVQDTIDKFFTSSANLSASVPRRQRAEDSSLTGGANVKRNSIKRQSVLLREKRKRRESENEREKNANYYRKVTGLRRAKVPLMVYSCGGFSRCFRIARFYDCEGPPVGVTYDRDNERNALNPDL